MRLATALVAVVVGCASPVGGQPDALPITTVGTDPPSDPSAPAQVELSGTVQAPELELPTRMSWAGGEVTSSYADTEGDVYMTGTFVGTLSVGGRRVFSKGDVDVFVAKWGPDASLVWLLGVGSPARESAPRITSVEPDRVHVVGLTEGRMDCGGGPLPIWSTETFFVCTFATTDGAWLGAGTFPTGSP